MAAGVSCSLADLTEGGPDAGPQRSGEGDAQDVADGFGAFGSLESGGPNFLLAPVSAVAIKNLLNQRYLDVADLGTSNSDPVWAWSYTGGANQLWTFMSMGDGSSEIVNQGSGKCLDVPANTSANGANLQQYECWGGVNQRWWLLSDEGNVQILGEGSRKCLTSATQADGAAVYIWDCSSDVSEQWAIGY